MKKEKHEMNQLEADNDFAERFYKIIINALVLFALLIILSLFLFYGEPDLHDSAIEALNNKTMEQKCQ